MWCQNYCYRLQSPSRSPPTVLLPNPQTASRPCHCWATTTRKHVEKFNFNGWNQIGRPVTLHSHSKDGQSDRTVTMTCIVKTNSPCLSSHDEDVNTFQFQQATIFTATLLFQPQLITTLYIIINIYNLSVCCFTHMHTDIISYSACSWDARNLQTHS